MLTFYVLRLFYYVAQRVSRPVGYRICTGLGYSFYMINRDARAQIKENMWRVLGPRATPPRVNRAVRNVFLHITKDYYDLLLLATAKPQEVLGLVDAVDLNRIDEAREHGRGVIAVFYHMAGFNLVSQASILGGWRAWVVAEPLQPVRMRHFVDRLRSALGVQLLPADLSGARRILRALRSNDVVVLAGDRDVTGNGVPVEFLGHAAMLPSGAAALSLRTGAKIVPVLSVRLPDNSVRLNLLPPVEFHASGDYDRDVIAFTQQVACAFEEHVRRHPDQWVIGQPIWRQATTAAARETRAPHTQEDLISSVRTR